MRIALSYRIVVADCDRGRIKPIVNLRLVAAKAFNNLIASIPSEAPAISIAEVVHVCEKRRRGATARRYVERRLNADDNINKQLPSLKLQRPFKGVVSHLQYQECLKEVAVAVALKYTSSGESNLSGSVVVKEM